MDADVRTEAVGRWCGEMMIEQYTLILKHEVIVDDKKIQIDPPLTLTHVFDRNFVGSSIVLNEMMDRFKDELLRRQIEWEGGDSSGS